MPNPYFLMAALFIFLALLGALDSALASFGVVAWFNGLRWLRVHLVTLGIFVETAFGLLPALVAARAGRPQPEVRWLEWLLLNAGLVALLVGIPLVNGPLLAAGGSLVFAAAALLIRRLRNLRAPEPARQAVGPAGLPFYIAGLGFLLVGIVIGTGLWLGWGQALRIASPKETHIHANLWGFTSLAFAGLLADLYPAFAGRGLAWPGALRPILWLMTLGALGLVLGPWLGVNEVMIAGLAAHLAATLWLLVSVIRPLAGDRTAWTPGLLHVLTSYFWLLAPVIAAPLIVLRVPGFPGAQVEANGPALLVFGWLLQFLFGIVPFVFARALLPDQPARLGGTRLSLAAAHLGGFLLAASMFVETYQAALYGAAYVAWLLGLGVIAAQVFGILRAASARMPRAASANRG